MTNPVKRLDTATRDARLLSSFQKGDRVRQSTRHEGEWLVSSSQFANVSYRVSYDPQNRRYSCGCEWNQRTTLACRHLVRVSWEIHQQAKHEKGLSYAAAD
jgi:hypothetical protein